MDHGKVLIIEDEEEVAELLAYNLHRAGLHPIVAHDGLTGCRLVQSETPNLLLLDLLLPDLEGWEICRMIREHPSPEVSALPIIMLTALATGQDRVRGLRLGADDYITKPFSIQEVVLKVERLISSTNENAALRPKVRSLEGELQATADLHRFLSHEIRNKMVVIGGFSNRLADSDRTVSGQQALHFARTIREHSQYLSTLTEEVLMLRQLEQEEADLPLQSMALEPVLEQVVDLHRTQAAEKEVSLTVLASPGCEILANPTAMRVCLSNLVENAVKYGPPGTRIEVRAASTGDRTTVEVSDTGVGIPLDEQEQVFDRFYRGSETAGDQPGTGLGLYIVRTLTRAMGGTATLESTPGQGTRIRLSYRHPTGREKRPVTRKRTVAPAHQGGDPERWEGESAPRWR